MNQIISLGGSNSVLKEGLISGVKTEADVLELALGATTSIQNLYEVCRNADFFSHYDFVLTESNVNDIHAYCCGIPLQHILKQIDCSIRI